MEGIRGSSQELRRWEVRWSGGLEVVREGGMEVWSRGHLYRGPGGGARGPWRRDKRSDRGWLGGLQVNRWGRLNYSQPERVPLGQ